jgi:hypothetical protein
MFLINCSVVSLNKKIIEEDILKIIPQELSLLENIFLEEKNKITSYIIKQISENKISWYIIFNTEEDRTLVHSSMEKIFSEIEEKLILEELQFNVEFLESENPESLGEKEDLLA